VGAGERIQGKARNFKLTEAENSLLISFEAYREERLQYRQPGRCGESVERCRLREEIKSSEKVS